MINELTASSLPEPSSGSFSSPIPTSACPGLFYNTPTLDGTLLRVRVPGGILNSRQLIAMANLATKYGDGQIYLTNRANLQVRSSLTALPADVLQQFQDLNLAARNPALDAIRNIMLSPTAGIDPLERYDTRPLAQDLEEVLQSRPEFADLPPKFSVCFDAAGLVSVASRPNDIILLAVLTQVGLRFRLRLGQAEGQWIDTPLAVLPEQCTSLVEAIAHVYLSYLHSGNWQNQDQLGQKVKIRRPRLRHLIADWGTDKFLQKVIERLTFSVESISIDSTDPNSGALPLAHLGIKPQRQSGLHYLGLVIPLGHLTVAQILGLADLTDRYGSGTVRLTPWQNLLLCDIPTSQIPKLQQELEQLGLGYPPSSYFSTLIACPGNRGCGSAATDAQQHAVALAQELEQQLPSNGIPIEIHVSGCDKSCAQPRPRGISLVGTQLSDKHASEGYDIYIQEPEQVSPQNRFGRLLYHSVPARQVSAVLIPILEKSIRLQDDR